MTQSTFTTPAAGVPTQPATATPSGGQQAARADGRLAGLVLMAGCVVTVLAFAAISVAVRGGAGRYTDPQWVPLYGIALAGNLLVVLGLPAILVVHSRFSRRLTLLGYVGVFAPLAMLNVAETTVEAFLKPYLATHGGVPQNDPTGLAVFEGVALLLLVMGVGCLAAAVFRARVLPRWVGFALIASVPLAFVLHTIPAAFISDYCILAALFRFGLAAARPVDDSDRVGVSVTVSG